MKEQWRELHESWPGISAYGNTDLRKLEQPGKPTVYWLTTVKGESILISAEEAGKVDNLVKI